MVNKSNVDSLDGNVDWNVEEWPVLQTIGQFNEIDKCTEWNSIFTYKFLIILYTKIVFSKPIISISILKVTYYSV